MDVVDDTVHTRSEQCASQRHEQEQQQQQQQNDQEKSAATDDEDDRVCWICHDGEHSANTDNDDNDKDAAALHRYCHCRGKTGWAHEACLSRWVFRYHSTQCAVCGMTYRVTRHAADAVPSVQTVHGQLYVVARYAVLPFHLEAAELMCAMAVRVVYLPLIVALLLRVDVAQLRMAASVLHTLPSLLSSLVVRASTSMQALSPLRGVWYMYMLLPRALLAHGWLYLCGLLHVVVVELLVREWRAYTRHVLTHYRCDAVVAALAHDAVAHAAENNNDNNNNNNDNVRNDEDEDEGEDMNMHVLWRDMVQTAQRMRALLRRLAQPDPLVWRKAAAVVALACVTRALRSAAGRAGAAVAFVTLMFVWRAKWPPPSLLPSWQEEEEATADAAAARHRHRGRGHGEGDDKSRRTARRTRAAVMRVLRDGTRATHLRIFALHMFTVAVLYTVMPVMVGAAMQCACAPYLASTPLHAMLRQPMTTPLQQQPTLPRRLMARATALAATAATQMTTPPAATTLLQWWTLGTLGMLLERAVEFGVVAVLFADGVVVWPYAAHKTDLTASRLALMFNTHVLADLPRHVKMLLRQYVDVVLGVCVVLHVALRVAFALHACLHASGSLTRDTNISISSSSSSTAGGMAVSLPLSLGYFASPVTLLPATATLHDWLQLQQLTQWRQTAQQQQRLLRTDRIANIHHTVLLTSSSSSSSSSVSSLTARATAMIVSTKTMSAAEKAAATSSLSSSSPAVHDDLVDIVFTDGAAAEALGRSVYVLQQQGQQPQPPLSSMTTATTATTTTPTAAAVTRLRLRIRRVLSTLLGLVASAPDDDVYMLSLLRSLTVLRARGLRAYMIVNAARHTRWRRRPRVHAALVAAAHRVASQQMTWSQLVDELQRVHDMLLYDMQQQQQKQHVVAAATSSAADERADDSGDTGGGGSVVRVHVASESVVSADDAMGGAVLLLLTATQPLFVVRALAERLASWLLHHCALSAMMYDVCVTMLLVSIACFFFNDVHRPVLRVSLSLALLLSRRVLRLDDAALYDDAQLARVRLFLQNDTLGSAYLYPPYDGEDEGRQQQQQQEEQDEEGDDAVAAPHDDDDAQKSEQDTGEASDVRRRRCVSCTLRRRLFSLLYLPVLLTLLLALPVAWVAVLLYVLPYTVPLLGAALALTFLTINARRYVTVLLLIAVEAMALPFFALLVVPITLYQLQQTSLRSLATHIVDRHFATTYTLHPVGDVAATTAAAAAAAATTTTAAP